MRQNKYANMSRVTSGVMGLSKNTKLAITILSDIQWRRDSVCRPGQTSVLPPPPIRSVLQSGYFPEFRTLGCEPTFGVLSYTLPSYSLPFPLFSSPSTLPLSPSGPKLKLVHFSIKIWHPVATTFKIFLRIKWPNFTQNFQILCRILKHVNSAKH